MVRRLALLVAALLLAAACDTGFQSQSIVVDLRILAVKSEPAEVVADVDPNDLASVVVPPVTFTGLISDPANPRPLSWTMTACQEEDSLRCDDEDITFTQPFASGTTADGPPSAVFLASVPLLMAALDADSLMGLGGIPVIVELVLRADDGAEVHAAKRIFYAPRIPAEKTANLNPTMTALLARGEDWPEGAPLTVARDEEIELEPVAPMTAREVYVVPTLDGGSRMFTENLRYSWLATAGDFTDEMTGGATDIFGNLPVFKTRWRAPKEPGTVTFWVVQRDERGGTYWTERTIVVP